MGRGKKLQGVLRARCHTAPFDGKKLVSCGLILEQTGESSLSLFLSSSYVHLSFFSTGHEHPIFSSSCLPPGPGIYIYMIYIYMILLSSLLTNSLAEIPVSIVGEMVLFLPRFSRSTFDTR